jgi:hypothetical protein
MIQPLRKAHLRIWTLLAAALAIVFTSALLVRSTEPLRNPGVQWENFR